MDASVGPPAGGTGRPNLGGTVSKEDVGEEAGNTAGNKRKRDDDNEDEALGAFALRFR